MRKKLKNKLNRENQKEIIKKTEPLKKNRLNWLEYLKNRPVRFWFHKPEIEKSNRTEINKKIEPKTNWAKPKPNLLEITKQKPQKTI